MNLNSHYFTSHSDSIVVGRTDAPRIPAKIIWERAKAYTPREIADLFQRAYNMGKADTLRNLSALMEDMTPKTQS